MRIGVMGTRASRFLALLLGGVLIVSLSTPSAAMADPVQPYPYDCDAATGGQGVEHGYGFCRKGLGSVRVSVMCRNRLNNTYSPRTGNWVAVGQTSYAYCDTTYADATKAWIQVIGP